MENRSAVQILREMFLAGATNLEKEKSTIDNLNVFPVPDGDTGTNMSLTLRSAATAIQGEFSGITEMGAKFAHGALMGARGNSGVILSQLISGFSKGLAGQEEVSASVFARAMQRGVEAAYKAVSNPVEGTILTVSRESVEGLEPGEEMSLEQLLEEMLERGRKSLNRTPELLPILKQSGVVDAGGMGYLIFLSGMLMAVRGEEYSLITELLTDMEQQKHKGWQDFTPSIGHEFAHEEVNFQYCTELLLHREGDLEFDEEAAKATLSAIGDSVLVVASEGIVKVHTHTNEPWQVLEYFGKYGSLNDIKIDNMKAQAQAYHQTQEEKPLAILSVSYGEGFNAIFRSLGTSYIISGGQTMNPSTEDILKAMEQIPAKAYMILPNNKNIILAAEQAAKISEKPLYIIYSKTLPQGITSLMSFNGEMAPETNQKAMNEALGLVRSIEITKAVRDTVLNGLEIREGQYIAISDGTITSALDDIREIVLESIEKTLTEESEIVTVYYGKDVEEEEAEALIDELSEIYEDLDFELHQGGQPLYPYIISVE